MKLCTTGDNGRSEREDEDSVELWLSLHISIFRSDFGRGCRLLPIITHYCTISRSMDKRDGAVHFPGSRMQHLMDSDS